MGLTQLTHVPHLTRTVIVHGCWPLPLLLRSLRNLGGPRGIVPLTIRTIGEHLPLTRITPYVYTSTHNLGGPSLADNLRGLWGPTVHLTGPTPLHTKPLTLLTLRSLVTTRNPRHRRRLLPLRQPSPQLLNLSNQCQILHSWDSFGFWVFRPPT